MTRQSVFQGGSLSRNERAICFALGLAINLIALLLLFAVRTPSQERSPRNGAATMAFVGTEKPDASPKTPVKPTLPTNLLQSSSMPALSSVTGGTTLTATNCDVLSTVANGLVSDPLAVQAVDRAPPDSRSVADAIVIWNGGWRNETIDADAPLAIVRSNVLTTLDFLPPECLAEQVSGPRFIPVANGDRTILLVFGSGTWSWLSLTETPGDVAEPLGLAGLCANTALPIPTDVDQLICGSR